MNPTIESMEECRKCHSSPGHLVQSSTSREDGDNSEQLLHHLAIWHGSNGMAHSGPTYRQLYQYMAFARLPVLSWLVSDNCSLLTLYAHIYVLLFVLMGPAVSAAPFSTDTWVGARDPPLGVTCSGGFFHQLHACVQPFLSGVGDGDLKKPATLSTHLCLEYKLALLCVHSALTQCPGLDNIRQVQATLGSPQAVQVNHLCSISSQNPTLSAGGEKTAQRLHRHRQHSAGNRSNGQPPGGLSLLTTTTQVQADVVYTTLPHSTTLPPGHKPGSKTLGPVLSQLSDPGSHDIRLNIKDFVNNYQFDKSPVQDTERSRTSLFQIVVGTSAGSVTQISLSLLFVVCVGLTLTVH